LFITVFIKVVITVKNTSRRFREHVFP
jgi:hypothetical protein